MKKIHRFITSYKIVNDKIEITDKELLHQWKNVLKFKIGEILVLIDKNNGEALCTIKTISKTDATLDVAEVSKNTREPKRNVTLYVAIFKRENFELVVQKATEIGVNKIVPIVTEHTVKTGLKYERLEKIAREATELCGRSTIPIISETMKFTDAIQDSKSTQTQIIFDISGKNFASIQANNCALFIGPEGGFTEAEIDQARTSGFITASLGPFTLRGETAGIVASYLALNL